MDEEESFYQKRTESRLFNQSQYLSQNRSQFLHLNQYPSHRRRPDPRYLSQRNLNRSRYLNLNRSLNPSTNRSRKRFRTRIKEIK